MHEISWQEHFYVLFIHFRCICLKKKSDYVLNQEACGESEAGVWFSSGYIEIKQLQKVIRSDEWICNLILCLK